jgi:uroporphyrinogen-III decarboxylase
LYEKYVINLIHTEAVETALERSVAHMQSWATENNSAWNHYFKYVSTNRAVYDIKDGKVSPWIILNSPTGKEMLSNFRDDQLSAIGNIIDPQIWVKKFKKQTFDLDLVKKIVKEASL